MIEVLRNKNLTTKFQMLVEIADRGPDIQQREIAWAGLTRFSPNTLMKCIFSGGYIHETEVKAVIIEYYTYSCIIFR